MILYNKKSFTTNRLTIHIFKRNHLKHLASEILYPGGAQDITDKNPLPYSAKIFLSHLFSILQ